MPQFTAISRDSHAGKKWQPFKSYKFASTSALAPIVGVEIACAFRRSRPGIPSEGGRLYRLKPAGDSDDPGHLPRRALVSTSSSGQLVGSASSL